MEADCSDGGEAAVTPDSTVRTFPITPAILALLWSRLAPWQPKHCPPMFFRFRTCPRCGAEAFGVQAFISNGPGEITGGMVARVGSCVRCGDLNH